MNAVCYYTPEGWQRVTAVHTYICSVQGYCTDHWTPEDVDTARRMLEEMHVLGLPLHDNGKGSLKNLFANGRRSDKSYGPKFPPCLCQAMARGVDR